jgi:cysteine synthase A
MKAENILQTIGNTPHVKLNRLYGSKANIYVKLEKANPGGSIKDRIALSMIEDAEKKGLLTKDSIIIEPTSGNTGVGLAMVAAVKGYPLILVMPESMSIERRRLMSAYGATFELTPREKGMSGAIEKAKQMVAERNNAWMPQQFENEANIQVHIDTTSKEILNDFPNGIDYLITGVGTGGHITGVAKVLKEKFPKLKVFAVEPAASPVITQTRNNEERKPGPHPIQGIGAGFIPKNLDLNLLDGVVQITKEEAFEFAVRSAKEEGIFLGVSSGASLAAVSKKLPEITEGSTVLTFCYDTGERYLSIEGLFA